MRQPCRSRKINCAKGTPVDRTRWEARKEQRSGRIEKKKKETRHLAATTADYLAETRYVRNTGEREVDPSNRFLIWIPAPVPQRAGERVGSGLQGPLLACSGGDRARIGEPTRRQPLQGPTTPPSVRR